MPNKKISQLPVATTPLSGSELVPVVQSSVTDQTTVQDFSDFTISSIVVDGVSIKGNGGTTPFTANVTAGQVAYGISGTGVLTSDSNFTRTTSNTAITNSASGTTASFGNGVSGLSWGLTNGTTYNTYINGGNTGWDLEYQGSVNQAGITLDNSEFTIKNFGTSWLFPHTDGTSNQALVTDGSGTLGWSDLPSSGTFSPTTSSLSNITSITVVEAIYTKVGSIATASYTMQVTPTATGACYAEIDLHIVSSLLGSGIGSGSAFDGSFYSPVLAYGGSTTSLCAFQFDAQSTSVYQVNFTVTYQS